MKNPGAPGGEAGSGGRLGQMSRRKSEITGHMNERDLPHLVELELPPGGFRNKSLEFESFHRERGITIRRGCGRHEGEQFHVRFCFPDAATADAFHKRFGGTRLTYSPSKPGRPAGPRLRYQRSYSPRVVGGKVMTPADLRRLHKYMLEIERVSAISDEMRAVVEAEWPELAHKLPPQR
jgi:hypothetical protein